MTKIVKGYWKWLAEQLTRYDQILVIGAMTWLLWCEKLSLPLPDLRSPAGWTRPVFFLVGMLSAGYFRMNRWWSDLQIRWVFKMLSQK